MPSLRAKALARLKEGEPLHVPRERPAADPRRLAQLGARVAYLESERWYPARLRDPEELLDEHPHP
jgi:hypothetical protein